MGFWPKMVLKMQTTFGLSSVLGVSARSRVDIDLRTTCLDQYLTRFRLSRAYTGQYLMYQALATATYFDTKLTAPRVRHMGNALIRSAHV